MLQFCPMRWKHKLVKTTWVRRKELPGRRTIVTLNESQVSEFGQRTRIVCVCVCVCVPAVISQFSLLLLPAATTLELSDYFTGKEKVNMAAVCKYVCECAGQLQFSQGAARARHNDSPPGLVRYGWVTDLSTNIHTLLTAMTVGWWLYCSSMAIIVQREVWGICPKTL